MTSQCSSLFFPWFLCHFQGTTRKELALPENVKSSIQSISFRSTSDVKDIVNQFQENLQLEPASLTSPEPETKSMIRGLALRAKSEKRDDLVRHLRKITPAGTTGEFKKDRAFFFLAKGDEVLRYKIMSTCSWFFFVLLDSLLIPFWSAVINFLLV